MEIYQENINFLDRGIFKKSLSRSQEIFLNEFQL